jgi:hypothetical protein
MNKTSTDFSGLGADFMTAREFFKIAMYIGSYNYLFIYKILANSLLQN